MTEKPALNILVLGAGGREHAIIRKLLVSPSCKSVVCAPGNGGIARDVECIDIFAPTDIANYCRKHAIDLVVIGPEEPLVLGVADTLRELNIAVFGPSAKAAQLEASKAFTKKLCDDYQIPTAKYAVFEEESAAIAYVRQHGVPIVVKADGLAGGKGVTVAMTMGEAIQAVKDCFDGAFGMAGAKVVIEEFLEGEEASFFALCDGTNVHYFASAQDHKRAYDNDKGPNTGGMGTFSPITPMDEMLRNDIMERIIKPTVEGLLDQGITYVGVLFAGLMLTDKGPKLIEYNCRFGDPETQVMLARFEGDLAALLLSCAQGATNANQLRFSDDAAICIVMASKGYPGKYVKGTSINGLDRAGAIPHVTVLHAGTAASGEDFISNGGRVLNIIGTGESLRQARMAAYEGVDCVDWPEGFCRRDIGAAVRRHSKPNV